MRICFIWTDVTAIGGVSTWILQCLRALPRLGVEARVINLAKKGSGKLDIRVVENLMTFVAPPTDWDSPALFRRRLRRALGKLRPDVLVLNEQIQAEEILQAAGGRIPVVNVVHSDRNSAYPIFIQLVKWGVPQWCVSRIIADKLSGQVPANGRDLVRYTLLGVETPEEALPRPVWRPGDVLRMIYLGRISKYQKQIQVLPDFLAGLRDRHLRAHIEVIGDGPEAGWLMDTVRERGLAELVTVKGGVSHQEAMRRLSDHHIYLLFSDFEGLPLAMLEAMVRGVLPVVTDLPSGISEVIEDGVNGRLFPVGDIDRALDVIEELMADEVTFERMRDQAIKTGGAYSFDRQLEEFVRRCEAVSAGPRPIVPPLSSSRLRDVMPVKLMKWRDRSRVSR